MSSLLCSCKEANKGAEVTRTLRQRSLSDIYHVIVRGAGRRILFEDDEDRRFFLGKLAKSKSACCVEIFAWCLMENHVHMLAKCDLTNLTALMRSLNTSFARYYNGRHGHVGPVFQDRFKSYPVEHDSYLVELVRYIHMNPQRAGACSYDAYPWSSYVEYTDEPSICTTELVLDCFGGPRSFLDFHKNAPDDEVEIDVVVVDGKITQKRAVVPDGEAIEIAKRFFGDEFANSIASLPRNKRNDALQRLRNCGLSVRQIERLTGVGRGVIQKLQVFDGG